MADKQPIPKQRRTQDLTGKTFGRLTVIRLEEWRKKLPYWRCRCSCGTETVVYRGHLARGHTTSCGCLHREVCTKHGKCEIPEYKIWEAIKQRCCNPNSQVWKYYGGRGIRLNKEWAESFAAFFEHVGPRPPDKHTIERINVDGGYEPGNVCWAIRSEQQRNRRDSRRIEFQGKNLSIAEWSELTGIRIGTIWNRLTKLGWSVEKALLESWVKP